MYSQENGLGLSLDQAPPVSVVYKFFFTGAMFGIIAGLVLFYYQTDIYQIGSKASLVFTHLLTVGVMLSFMFAALFQMLPVLAGVKLTSPIKRSNLLLYPLIVGVVSLVLGFMTSSPIFFLGAGLFLGTSILLSIIPMLRQLFMLKSHTSSSKGILWTLLALALVVLFAFYLLATLLGVVSGEFYASLKVTHYSFGLYGWISLLIISISFQVIEMFYVTPSFPKLMTKYLPMVLMIVLILSTIIGFFQDNIWIVSHTLISLLLAGYALLTLKRLTQKKRPLSDATIRFWQVGLTSLLFSMLLMSIGNFSENATLHIYSYIFFASFALSIVFAMFYKIIPFITWFHLNSQGFFNAPMMHQVISPKTAQKHLYIHIATITAYLLSAVVSPIISVAALLTVVSFGWIAYQVINAHKLYEKTHKSGKKFGGGM